MKTLIILALTTLVGLGVWGHILHHRPATQFPVLLELDTSMLYRVVQYDDLYYLYSEYEEKNGRMFPEHITEFFEIHVTDDALVSQMTAILQVNKTPYISRYIDRGQWRIIVPIDNNKVEIETMIVRFINIMFPE
jgi:hypothetical protein